MRRLLAGGFLCLLFVGGVFQVPAARAENPVARVGVTNPNSPWDFEQLQQVPAVTWVDQTGPLRKLYYEGEPRNGQPTRVFAYCAFPEKIDGKVPAVVLIHGGGGRAFPEWAQLWADRGYIALAMDLAGKGPDGQPLPDGGPDQTDDFKLSSARQPLKSMWTYHAVAACVRAHSLLRSLPEVDAEKTGVTGISWGGYLTCIVSGVDQRFKFSVPVYGCGFLADDSVWIPRFQAMPEDWRTDWLKNFDPSSHVGRATMPMLFVNGTNDFAYPLGSYQKTYRLVKDRTLCITVNMPHGHAEGWAPKEIGLFADQIVRKGEPLAKIGPRLVVTEDQSHVTTSWSGAENPHAEIHWTTDRGPWQQRKWQTAPAEVSDTEIHARLPAERPLAVFVTLKDGRGAIVSTEHEELTAKE